VNPRKLLKRLSDGALQNVEFAEFTNLIEGFGFRVLRVSGSHHIYGHNAVAELVNIQNWHGEAKPYQIRQFLRLVERYNLRLES
jgi:predicted RNA binding protein YcfA (HicA-like mRNA interferase family)